MALRLMTLEVISLGAGRPPTMDHQMRFKGRRLSAEEAEKMSLKERRRIDVPLKPPQFSEKKFKKQSQIWDDHIRRAPWLIEADTAKLIMFCYLYAKYLQDPDGMKSPMFGNLRTLGAELGFDPLSRTRMKRSNLPVRDYSDYPSHAGKNGHGKIRGKKEERRRSQAFYKEEEGRRAANSQFGDYE